MQSFSDRRIERRFEINGAKIKYRKLNRLTSGGRMVGPIELIDISKSGASFPIFQTVEKGDYIQVEIAVPGEDQIRAEAVVQWFAGDIEKKQKQVGVHFCQFGWEEPWNFIQYSDRMQKMIDKREFRVDSNLIVENKASFPQLIQ